MSGVNKACLLGRLGRNPETTITQAGIAICKFSIATSRKQKNGEEVTQWHRLTAFQKSAELIQQYVKKGDQLYVEGEINYSQYDKNGVTMYSTDIIVREFNFIGGGQGSQNQQQRPQQYQQQGGNQQGYQPQNQQQNQRPSQGAGYQGGYVPPQQNTNPAPPGPVDDSEIPF